MTNPLQQRAMTLLFLALLCGAAASATPPPGFNGTLDVEDVRGGRDHGAGGIESSDGDECQLFGDAAQYPTGDYPYSVAVGDFDGDGVQDLAVANLGSSHVSVLLGLGDGSFAAEQRVDTGRGPVSVAVGDFDGNGVQDLAVANRYSDDVSVLLGLGDGRFAEDERYGLWDADAPQSVAVGDFNGDGSADLVVANSFSNDIHLLRGRGNGRFVVYMRYEVGFAPHSVAVGDFDNDDLQDLAVANAGGLGQVSVLLGLGDGSFAAEQRFAAGTSPLCVAVGEFDGDGVQDLAVAAWVSVAVLLGLGDGSFAEEQNYDPGDAERSVAIGDFDGDGVQDLAVGQESDHVSVLLGLGDGSFAAEQRYDGGEAPGSVAVGDFDGDGAQDLAVTDRYTDNVSVLINRCSTLAIEIDIKPHSYPNNINPHSRGVIPVAILSDDTFDVADVDESTLRFGPGAAPIAHRHGHFEDVNYDGLMDLVIHYRTQDTGIACGDRSATLTGETLDGQPIEGTDSIQTVGCRVTRRPAIWMKDPNRPETGHRNGPVDIDRK